jgi:hypothetical protein
MDNIILKAQKMYPKRKYKESYIEAIKHIEDPSIRTLIMLDLMCGFRFGELINSYVYFDEIESKYIIRAVEEKGENHKMPITCGGNRGAYLGEKELNNLLNYQPNAFKSVHLVDIFDFGFNELDYILSPNFRQPIWIGDRLNIKSYHKAYMRLRKMKFTLPVIYRQSIKEVGDYLPDAKVGFHFFRKLFSAEFYTQTGNDMVKTVQMLRWAKHEMLFVYIKDY